MSKYCLRLVWFFQLLGLLGCELDMDGTYRGVVSAYTDSFQSVAYRVNLPGS